MMDPYLAVAISRTRSGAYPDICDAELILAELDKVSGERDALKEVLAADINFLSQLSSALVNKNSGEFKCAWTDYGEKLTQIVARRVLESKL